jgi:hypothetical protein
VCTIILCMVYSFPPLAEICARMAGNFYISSWQL